jgi:hypothetical protein
LRLAYHRTGGATQAPAVPLAMLTLLLIWLVLATSMMLLSRRFSAGLPLAYFMGLSFIHVPGALLIDEWDENTLIGFEQTLIGMACFLVTVMMARYVTLTRHPYSNTIVGHPQHLPRQGAATLDSLALCYIIVGGVAYFLAMPFAAMIPSATALVSSLGSLLLIGFCLRLWTARECRNWPKFWSAVALLPLLPLATVIVGGFLGFGTYWVLVIGCFFFAQARRHLGYFLLTPAVLFVGLSVFVNYMVARNEIREVVWDERTSFGDRLQRVDDVFRNFEWLDLSKPEHRVAIRERLDENRLLGAAVERLEAGDVEYASGATLGHVIIGLIPRALWPDKPVVGGGGTVVSEFTGLEFAEGTSVGAGQVFEFYINFGTIGVIGGFLLYGWIFGWMDLQIIECLYRGDQRRFLLWFMVCLALLKPGGNLLEIVVSTVSSTITALGLGYFLSRWQSTANVAVARGTLN